jgi:predicted RNA-binding protein YlxR (DUF448 family)
MCIICRKRFSQNELHRLQCVGSAVVGYRNFGRSFYLCEECLRSPKIAKQVARTCGMKEPDLTLIEALKGESVWKK